MGFLKSLSTKGHKEKRRHKRSDDDTDESDCDHHRGRHGHGGDRSLASAVKTGRPITAGGGPQVHKSAHTSSSSRVYTRTINLPPKVTRTTQSFVTMAPPKITTSVHRSTRGGVVMDSDDDSDDSSDSSDSPFDFSSIADIVAQACTPEAIAAATAGAGGGGGCPIMLGGPTTTTRVIKGGNPMKAIKAADTTDDDSDDDSDAKKALVPFGKHGKALAKKKKPKEDWTHSTGFKVFWMMLFVGSIGYMFYYQWSNTKNRDDVINALIRKAEMTPRNPNTYVSGGPYDSSRNQGTGPMDKPKKPKTKKKKKKSKAKKAKKDPKKKVDVNKPVTTSEAPVETPASQAAPAQAPVPPSATAKAPAAGPLSGVDKRDDEDREDYGPHGLPPPPQTPPVFESDYNPMNEQDTDDGGRGGDGRYGDGRDDFGYGDIEQTYHRHQHERDAENFMDWGPPELERN